MAMCAARGSDYLVFDCKHVVSLNTYCCALVHDAADTAPPQEIITGDDGTVHSIHRAAFISVLAHLSMKFSKDAINDMWLAIDRDESGTICLDEVSDFLEEHDQYRGS